MALLSPRVKKNEPKFRGRIFRLVNREEKKEKIKSSGYIIRVFVIIIVIIIFLRFLIFQARLSRYLKRRVDGAVTSTLYYLAIHIFESNIGASDITEEFLD